jgi:hypothetical protein
MPVVSRERIAMAYTAFVVNILPTSQSHLWIFPMNFITVAANE